MDLIPLSSSRLQRENTEEGQGQVAPSKLLISPCSHPHLE